jgi:SAM-dependent methyltransferase
MYCNSLERHRLVWLYFEKMTDLFDGAPKTMLHVAPEPMIQGLLKERLASGYLTADLFSPAAMVKMDITDIQYGDDTFDVIYCSHVLEHVPDDRRAMREFRRVLKPHGWAVLLVPIVISRTFEDPSITDPAERAKLFGQHDHVRIWPRLCRSAQRSGLQGQADAPYGLPAHAGHQAHGHYRCSGRNLLLYKVTQEIAV